MKVVILCIQTLGLLLLAFSSPVFADDVVHGEIEFEEDIERTKSYAETQEELIERLRLLSAFSAAPSDSPDIDSFALADDHLLQVAALYLYCSINRGTCPEILDTVLELDVIQSRISGSPECSHMKRFWKAWIDNDMQKRLQFQVKTGYMKEVQEFKVKSLPKYLRCSATVTAALEAKKAASNQEFFLARYNLPSVPRQAITNTLGNIEDAKRKDVNLLFVTGTKR